MSFPDPYDRDDYKSDTWLDDLEDRVSARLYTDLEHHDEIHDLGKTHAAYEKGTSR